MIVIEKLQKTYKSKDGIVNALDSVDLEINKGEFVVLRGPSGCGKTTLLMTIAGMLHPTSGKICIGDQNLYKLSVQKRARFRAERIGFVFQMFHLVPYLNVLDNVALAGGVAELKPSKDKVKEIVNHLGLKARSLHEPGQLSAGEKQRTAIARALLNNPDVILADEPTGNLDPKNAHTVLQHLAEFRDQGGTVITVTHGEDALQYACRTIEMNAGRIL